MPWQLSRQARAAHPQPDLPFVPPLWRRVDRQVVRDTLFIAMMTTSWLCGNALGVLGCVVAAFIIISHGDFAVFMAHVDNIASRYVAADLGRRASFEHQVVLALAIVGAALLLIRLPRFVMRLRVELSEDTGHAD